MKFIYSKWSDDSLTDEKLLEKLIALFSYTLLQTSGDVNEALDWLSQLDEKFSLFGDNITFSEFIHKLKERGYVGEERGKYELKYNGIARIRKDSFNEIFGRLKKSPEGLHELPDTGKGVERLSQTKKFTFGDQPHNINPTQTLTNAFIRDGIDSFTLREEDLELYETEMQVCSSTALLLDISHSMILYGEDRITPAKQVALALSELILTKFKKDSLNVILFGDEAKEVSVAELPFVSVGPFHTNTKAGLELARHLLNKSKNANKHIIMITDGKPSAVFDPPGSKKLYKNSFGLDPKIVNKTLDEAIACRRDKINITTFMIASDNYLRNFVKDFAKVCGGKAYYSSLNELGEHVFVDYIRSKQKPGIEKN